MGYWHIRETGFVSGINRRKPKPGEPHPPLEASIWETLVRTLEDIVPRLASGIRAGRFPVYNADDQCTARCPYQTVCRVTQIRALPDEMDKTWEP
jgi:hypothetical protein